MCFDDPVSSVAYRKLRRVEQSGQLHLDEGYSEVGNNAVNNLHIPLDGYWGRGPPAN